MSSSPFLARKGATQLTVLSGCSKHLVPDLLRQTWFKNHLGLSEAWI
jgi:hypothetical protein